MPVVVFLPGANIHHHDLLRGHHLIGFLGTELMIRRLIGHVLRGVRLALDRSAADQQRKRGDKTRK